jgi:hypothetical protein
MSRVAKLRGWLRERGVAWTALYGLCWVGVRAVAALERALIAIEKRRFLTAPGTISSSRHTAQKNRRIWKTYDWSQRGQEWTAAAKSYRGLDPGEWKRSLIDTIMRPRIPRGAVALEIGPDGGRWTETLATIAGRGGGHPPLGDLSHRGGGDPKLQIAHRRGVLRAPARSPRVRAGRAEHDAPAQAGRRDHRVPEVGASVDRGEVTGRWPI